jgi:hypothetical protein
MTALFIFFCRKYIREKKIPKVTTYLSSLIKMTGCIDNDCNKRHVFCRSTILELFNAITIFLFSVLLINIKIARSNRF